MNSVTILVHTFTEMDISHEKKLQTVERAPFIDSPTNTVLHCQLVETVV